MEQNVEVSIICVTYNHKKYIHQCLDNMLNQKTNFKYEIIVHDDASTDGTTEIVKEYAEQYPNIVKLILQKKNQYSCGKWITELALPKAKGKYLAFCDGDDYWCDESKLQKQFDYMEAHGDCSICFHNTYTYDMYADRIKQGWFFWKNRCFSGAGIYRTEQLMRLEVTPCSSHFYRKADIDFSCNHIICADMLITLCLSSKGYGYCLPGYMSVYRKGVTDSTYTHCYFGVEEYNRTIQYVIDVWKAFNYYSQNIYKNYIDTQIANERAKKISICNDDIKTLQKETSQLYIYGIGIYGAVCLEEMKHWSLNITGFVVSDGCEKPDTYKKYKVFYLSELKDKNCGFIIAAGINARNKIIENLNNRSVSHYCIGLKEVVHERTDE